MNKQDIRVDGLSATVDMLATTYAAVRPTAVPEGRPGMALSSAPVGQVRLDHVWLDMSCEVGIDPLEALVFNYLHAGAIHYSVGGEELDIGAGDIYLTADPDLPYTARFGPHECTVAVVSPAVVHEVAQGAPGRHEWPIRFTGLGPVSPAAGERWKQTLSYVWTLARTGPGLATQPLVAASAARLLIAAALATFPNTAHLDPTIEDRHDAHARMVRRAIAFIDSSADSDISVADIARECRTTIRAVRLAFLRHLGTTPTAYLTRVRLRGAHDELLAATPQESTVALIAGRWGFAHATEFARSYVREFHELPTQTLAR